MDTLTKFIPAGVVFVLVLATGFWMSAAGKPYNGILFTIHKLIALAVVILTAVQVVGALRVVGIRAVLILLVFLAIAAAVALFASGALMSMGKLNIILLRGIHLVSPLLMVGAVGLLVYLLARNAVY